MADFRETMLPGQAPYTAAENAARRALVADAAEGDPGERGEAMAPRTRPTADAINAHLASGGVVQVTTYGKSTVYHPRSAGVFLETKDGSLAVRRGRSIDRLSMGAALLVSVRFGRYV